jgi:integrase
MVRKKPLRVLGPYPNRGGYRLVILEEDKRKSITAPTLEQALSLKADLGREVAEQVGRTIGQVLSLQAEYTIRVRGLSVRTARQVEHSLSAFLPVLAPLTAITKERAEKLYEEETLRISRRGTPVAADSHRLLLKRARAFYRFAKERGYCRDNPFEDIKPVGKPRAGKPQLRIDEARKFMQAALLHAQSGEPFSVAVLLLLLLGLRASEAMLRLVRDVDDGGRVLWVSHGKTRNARRRLQVPELLQPFLRALIQGKRPEDWLFGTTRTGHPQHPEYLWNKVRALCQEAGVPAVCPHSLRGLHSTLALQAGATADLVASALGHASFAITAKHYADPDTVHHAKVRRVTLALGTGTPESSDAVSLGALSADQLFGFLREQLTPEQLVALRRRLSFS